VCTCITLLPWPCTCEASTPIIILGESTTFANVYDVNTVLQENELQYKGVNETLEPEAMDVEDDTKLYQAYPIYLQSHPLVGRDADGTAVFSANHLQHALDEYGMESSEVSIQLHRLTDQILLIIAVCSVRFDTPESQETYDVVQRHWGVSMHGPAIH
jgi:hypothetical protein